MDDETAVGIIEETFKTMTGSSEVGIILINQHIAQKIRGLLRDYTATIPTVLEIPAKDHPYDPEQDYIMQRVNLYLGGGEA